NVRWTNSGIEGASRFLHRLWRLYRDSFSRFVTGWRDQLSSAISQTELAGADRQVRRKLHQTIRKVTADVEAFSFNTAIAAMMELVNELYGYVQGAGKAGSGRQSDVILSEALENLALLLAPMAPHLADELWERLGREGYTYHARWPEVDEAAAAEDEITFAIQVNGKLRDRLVVPAATSDEQAREQALSAEKVQPFVTGKTVRRVIVVPRKLINIVTD
ncbi:MAG: class I tRNA ligase family protein, partial [Chloroflexi bacterium]|nr:class I tRNA ligase family protein [Chloroflexota bacterium]